MATTLETARSIGLGAVLQLPSRNENYLRFDHALRMCGGEFVRRTLCARSVDESLALAVDSAVLDYSPVADFRPDRLIRAELLYPGGEAWQDGASYSENDLVSHDGLLYVAAEDHTASSANQPGVGDVWSAVNSEVAHRVKVASYPEVAALLRDGGGAACDPRLIAFRPESSEMVLGFVPDTAWRVRLVQWEPFTQWDYGTMTPSGVVLNIPDDMIDGVLWWGIPAYYGRNQKQHAEQAYALERFEQHIRRCAGQVNDGSGAVVADESAYL